MARREISIFIIFSDTYTFFILCKNFQLIPIKIGIFKVPKFDETPYTPYGTIVQGVLSIIAGKEFSIYTCSYVT